MSEFEPRIDCRDVAIRYKVGDFKAIGLKEWIVRRLKGDLRIRNFWAVDGVTFSLGRGDFLGIVGTNGAGKSTLLKAVSGIMQPSRGTCTHQGRIAPFLELTSGFDNDLTVKENAYLRGAMLGYTRRFMDDVYDEIIRFSGLGEFENFSFRQLSSGMRSRLAFALASLVRPDILILDEVLSVGDGDFKRKSEAKMREIIRGGAISILVSHALPQIRSMCNKVLWLHRGRQIEFTEDVAGCCARYEAFLDSRDRSKCILPGLSQGFSLQTSSAFSEKGDLNYPHRFVVPGGRELTLRGWISAAGVSSVVRRAGLIRFRFRGSDGKAFRADRMWFSEEYGNYTYLRLDDDGRHRFNLRIVVPSRAVTMDMAFMRFAGPADMKIDAFELVLGSDAGAMDPTDENLRN